MAESAAALNLHVQPLERARRTRGKYATHRTSVLTWAVWKGVLKDLLPMSEDMLRAFIWDSLAFHARLPVLKHHINAIKAWHRRLGLRVVQGWAGIIQASRAQPRTVSRNPLWMLGHPRAMSTITCSRCQEVAMLQSCDLWPNYDGKAGWRKFKGRRCN